MGTRVDSLSDSSNLCVRDEAPLSARALLREDERVRLEKPDAPVRQNDDDAELCPELERHLVLLAVLCRDNEVRHLARELAARLAAEREHTRVDRERVGFGELRRWVGSESGG